MPATITPETIEREAHMVFMSDKQLECDHSVGEILSGEQMPYINHIFTNQAEIMLKWEGARKFNFCPWCGAPVAELLGEVEK